jgi:iron-sulfur cluster assembly accessory protein
MNKEGNPNRALRIQVESGGCHGFQYLMSLTNIPPIDASAQQPMPTPTATPEGQDGVVKETTGIEKVDLSEDDTVFEADTGARVVMDGPSLELLKGSKVDYTVELIGSQFKIVDNPLATSSCGCGTSFDIKI